MRTFATKEIKEIKGDKILFKKLQINNVCPFDVFVEEVKKNNQYFSEYKTILSYMNFFAQGNLLPKKHYNEIKERRLKNNGIKCHEFKSKHIRIYVLDQLFGGIVIIGGYKTSQLKDVNKLIPIVLEFTKTA